MEKSAMNLDHAQMIYFSTPSSTDDSIFKEKFMNTLTPTQLHINAQHSFLHLHLGHLQSMLQELQTNMVTIKQHVQSIKRNPYAWIFNGDNSQITEGKQLVEEFIKEIALDFSLAPSSYSQQCFLNDELWSCYATIEFTKYDGDYYIESCEFSWSKFI